ncbi:MAG: hypothetical protein FJ304_22235 [Planctomycetes bacterium]|nr:hypothetical protein [Planctomycetota bacterium]
MSNDPFAVHNALTELATFGEQLAGELRCARAPLETELHSLLLAWDASPGRAELAARVLAVGSAIRAAGLDDEVRRLRASVTRTGAPDVVTALLHAAVEGDAARIEALLANLDTLPKLRPGVRVSLGRHAEQLLVVWCDRHATGYPARFRAELGRLNLERRRVETWYYDDAPDLTDEAALVLGNLLDGAAFAVGWLAPPVSLSDAIAPDPVPPQRGAVPANEAGARTVENPNPTRPASGKKTKGKNINARMLEVLSNERAAFAWTAAQWAARLGCAESTVKESETWRKQLRKLRETRAAEQIHRELEHIKNVNGSLDGVEFEQVLQRVSLSAERALRGLGFPDADDE